MRQLKRVYIWELPVRVFHWINALMITILVVTGFLIANPPALLSIEEASFRYWFGMIRFIHFAAAFIFVFNYIFRVYWSFVGNKHAHWSAFLPLKKKYIQNMWRVFRIDILLQKGKPLVAVGHNPLAAFSYFLLFFIVIIQVVTGFALYADMSSWWFPKLFAWVTPLLGGDFAVRFIHHIAMWVFIVFTIIHIYLVIYHDIREGEGEMSSITSGYIFREDEELEEQMPVEDEKAALR